MLNTKLAVEYERQYHNKFPSLKTSVEVKDNLVFLNLEFRKDETVYNLQMSYKSVAHTNDIPCRLTDGNKEIIFVDSFKTMEMNINNLIIAANTLLK